MISSVVQHLQLLKSRVATATNSSQHMVCAKTNSTEIVVRLYACLPSNIYLFAKLFSHRPMYRFYNAAITVLTSEESAISAIFLVHLIRLSYTIRCLCMGLAYYT